MASASGTPQSMLYQARGAVSDNRDRSAEQRHSNSGNPMQPIFNTTFPTNGAQYTDPYGGQNPNLGRYTPSTIANAGSGGSPQWNNNMGGYSYNLPNAYGGYQGVGLYGQQNWLQDYLAGGGPKMPQFGQGQAQAQAKPMQMQQPQPQPMPPAPQMADRRTEVPMPMDMGSREQVQPAFDQAAKQIQPMPPTRPQFTNSAQPPGGIARPVMPQGY